MTTPDHSYGGAAVDTSAPNHLASGALEATHIEGADRPGPHARVLPAYRGICPSGTVVPSGHWSGTAIGIVGAVAR